MVCFFTIQLLNIGLPTDVNKNIFFSIKKPNTPLIFCNYKKKIMSMGFGGLNMNIQQTQQTNFFIKEQTAVNFIFSLWKLDDASA